MSIDSFIDLVSTAEKELMMKRDAMHKRALNKDTILAVDRWLKTAQDTGQIEKILELLQRGGMDEYSSKVLFPQVEGLVLNNKNTSIAATAFWIICDMFDYTEIDEPFIHKLVKSTNVERENRVYKLAKSTLLSRILATNRYSMHRAEINEWMKQIFTSKDTEYIDLLAFSVGTEGVKITEELRHIFHNYIRKNRLADASAEMAVSLARIQDPFVHQYIVNALDGDPGDPWIEAALLFQDDSLQKKLYASVPKERIKEVSDGLAGI